MGYFLILIIGLLSFENIHANEAVVYLSKPDMEKAIHGDPRLFFIPLGGKDFRKHYSELSVDPQQMKSFDILKSLIPNYPLAVVTRGKLIFKTDDNCTFAPDAIYRKDISEVCRNHDYCFRSLADQQTSESDQNHFRKCNQNFFSQIKAVCRKQGKGCLLSEYYAQVVQNITYPVYERMKFKQLRMSRDLLIALKQRPEAKEFLLQNKFFNLQELESKYVSYCAWIQNRLDRNFYVRQKEQKICSSF